MTISMITLMTFFYKRFLQTHFAQQVKIQAFPEVPERLNLSASMEKCPILPKVQLVIPRHDLLKKGAQILRKRSLNAVLMDPNDKKTELSQNFGTDAREKIDNFLTYEYRGRGASDLCGGPFAVF